jgi:hypothetical protein
MVLTGSFVLPGDRGVLPPSPADMFCLSPVGPTQLRELDTSVGVSGPHDFAVRSNIVRQPAVLIAHGSLRTRPASRCAPDAAASTASAPRVRDDRDTPLWWGGMRKVLEVIGGCGNRNIFRKIRNKTRQPCQKAARRANHHTAARANSTRVPDAVQRSSRCSAEPGPIVTVARWTPALQRTAARCAASGERCGTAGGLSDVSDEGNAARAHFARVPDAAQRSSRCSAEPGPMSN